MAVTGTIDFTSVGSTTWEVPFAVTSVTATAIGGGGGGYRDCTGDDEGGGGGGGGFARSTKTVTPGDVLSIRVGDGGFTSQCNTRNGLRGGDSFVKFANGNPIAAAYGGEGGTDDSGGGGGGVGEGTDVDNPGQRGDDDDRGGEGGGAGNQNGNSGQCSGSRPGGRGTNLNGTQAGCTGGQNGGNYGGGGGGSGDADTPGAGAQGAVRIVYTYAEPIISVFEVTPVQDSGSDGIPNDNVTFNWSTAYANDIKITWSGGTVASDLDATDKLTYNTGLQSVAGSNSPATRTYTLTATGPGGTATATATTKVYNDNCPDTITIPDQLGKEPGQEIFVSTSVISGIDMVTSVVCGPGVNVLGSSGGYTTSRTITAGSSLTFRVYAEGFNTDENGLVNEKEVYVTIGCQTVTFKVQTRAPVIKEIFDFGDNQFAYPYPKTDTKEIGDTLPDGGTYSEPTQYLKSPTIVEPTSTAWEVELENPYGVQIKAKDKLYSGPNTNSYTNITSQNDTDLEVNVQRSGNPANNTWTKPNII
jgi:hypothetical protein